MTPLSLPPAAPPVIRSAGLNRIYRVKPRFRVLLVDPPWFYNNRRATRKDNPEQKTKFGMGVDAFYEEEDGFGCMTDQQIFDMGPSLRRVAADDAYLFLWTTCPRYPLALAVMEAWGWRFVTDAFVWIKTYPKADTYFQGPGGYTWSNAECCMLGAPPDAPEEEVLKVLLGVRGKLWHDNKKGCWKPSQVIEAPQPRCPFTKKIIRSRKPPIVREKLTQWFPDQPKLEVFAREWALGWTSVGAALSGLDINEDLGLFQLDDSN